MSDELPVHCEIPDSGRDFASGLLIDLIAALRDTPSGDLIALTSSLPGVADDLDRWSRMTGNAVVARTVRGSATRYIVRNGPARGLGDDEEVAVGSRLWLYTNFDCNLACDYCCVRSSPRAERRALGLDRIEAIASQAAAEGVREIFVTGGEPFVLDDIGPILQACARAAKTTVLTNGMLFQGKRLDALRSLPRDRVTLQVSLDSPDPGLHDRHRGEGSWERARGGIAVARGEGFRVRLAATVADDTSANAFEAFLDQEGIPAEDRVIRRVALRGFAQGGVALGRADIVPEITITAEGVFFHPVGATDQDFFVTRDILPLARAVSAVRKAFEAERAHADRLASVFHCA